MKKNREFKNQELIVSSFKPEAGVYAFSEDLTSLNKIIKYEYDQLIGDFNYKSPFLSKVDFVETRSIRTDFAVIAVDTNFDDGGCNPLSTTASIKSVEVTNCKFGKKLPLCVPSIKEAFDDATGTRVFTQAMDELWNVVYKEREKRAILGNGGSCVGAIASATASGITISGTSSFAVSTSVSNGILGTLKAMTDAMNNNEPAWIQLQTAGFSNLAASLFNLNLYHVNPYDVVESEGGFALPWAPHVRVYPSMGGDSFSKNGFTKYALLHYDAKYTKAVGFVDTYANGYDLSNRTHILDTVIGIGVNFAVPTTLQRPIVALGV